MSHPNPVPPVAATIGRLRWHTDVITREPGRHTADQLADLGHAALDLAVAADDPRGYLRLVRELRDAQAAMEAQPTEDAAILVIGLVDEFMLRLGWQRGNGARVQFVAQRDTCAAAAEKRSKR